MYQEFFSGSNLLIWPLIGLVIFIASFAAVLFYAFVGLRDRDKVDHLAGLPLDPGGEVTTDTAEGKVN